jgi:hypothetical protein
LAGGTRASKVMSSAYNDSDEGKKRQQEIEGSHGGAEQCF